MPHKGFGSADQVYTYKVSPQLIRKGFGSADSEYIQSVTQLIRKGFGSADSVYIQSVTTADPKKCTFIPSFPPSLMIGIANDI